MDQTEVQQIDLRGTPCPMNWVKSKLRLEQMKPGELLEIILDDGDPMRNVPGSVRAEGHRIVEAGPLADGFRLLVERGC
ncbi:MAG: sulfurtransferase TusA family protein [Armatimonadota bacterium]